MLTRDKSQTDISVINHSLRAVLSATALKKNINAAVYTILTATEQKPHNHKRVILSTISAMLSNINISLLWLTLRINCEFGSVAWRCPFLQFLNGFEIKWIMLALEKMTPDSVQNEIQIYWRGSPRANIAKCKIANQINNKVQMAKRAFRCTAPAIWNSLPKTVLDSDTVTSFKSRVKTHLFSQAFSHTPTDH